MQQAHDAALVVGDMVTCVHGAGVLKSLTPKVEVEVVVGEHAHTCTYKSIGSSFILLFCTFLVVQLYRARTWHSLFKSS